MGIDIDFIFPNSEIVEARASFGNEWLFYELFAGEDFNNRKLDKSKIDFNDTEFRYLLNQLISDRTLNNAKKIVKSLKRKDLIDINWC